MTYGNDVVDFENWFGEAKESAVSFADKHPTEHWMVVSNYTDALICALNRCVSREKIRIVNSKTNFRYKLFTEENIKEKLNQRCYQSFRILKN